MVVANKCAIIVGNSVVWPIIVIACDQLKKGAVVAYDIVGRPVVDAVFVQYKAAEDFALINFLGPTAKVIIDNVPQKNPFCDDTDEDLNEFIPGPVGAESTEDEEEGDTTEDDELPEFKGKETKTDVHVNISNIDDLDDDSFLIQRLNREFSGSDSSEEEFRIFPRKEKPRKRRKFPRKSEMLYN